MIDRACKGILLTEDDQDIREQMAEILTDEGYEVVTAEHGKAALEYLKACPKDKLPGCLILDLMMPVMTGKQLLDHLHEHHSHDLALIPAVIATAKGSPKAELHGLPHTVATIRKPMDIDELIEIVAKHCGKPPR